MNFLNFRVIFSLKHKDCRIDVERFTGRNSSGRFTRCERLCVYGPDGACQEARWIPKGVLFSHYLLAWLLVGSHNIDGLSKESIDAWATCGHLRHFDGFTVAVCENHE